MNLYVLISSILLLGSLFAYLPGILNGIVKPHRTSRLIFLIIDLLTITSLFAQGNQIALFLSGASVIQSIIIFLLSIKYGMGGYSKQDLICLFMALTGIILWRITSNPIIALYCAISADFIGMIPTIIKTYRFPKTENWIPWAMCSLAAMINLLAIENKTLQVISYPLYLMLINFVMVPIIFYKHFLPNSKKTRDLSYLL